MGTFGQIRLDWRIGTFGKVGGQTRNDAQNLENLVRVGNRYFWLDQVRLQNRYFWQSWLLDWK